MSYIGNQPYQVAFVSDQFSGNGSTTAFTMSVAPANTASVLVSITGVLQDPSTYSVSGTTLTFSAAPPVGTGNISTRYLGIPASGVTTTAYRTVTEFTATAGQTTFTPPSYTVGFINVYVNGVLQGSADYTASNGTTVVLAAAATAGDLVTTESFYVSSVLNAIPATAGAVNSTYIATGAVTQDKLGTVYQNAGPAFSTVFTGTASSATVVVTLTTNSVVFDTSSAMSTSTGRFTPQTAGYYFIAGDISLGGATTSGLGCYLQKNGSTFAQAAFPLSSLAWGDIGASGLVYLNGSTDYVTVGVYTASGSGTATGRFSGALVRGA